MIVILFNLEISSCSSASSSFFCLIEHLQVYPLIIIFSFFFNFLSFDPVPTNRRGEAQLVDNKSNVSRSGSSSTHTEVEVKCHHKLESCLRMITTSSNLGKKFYGCSLWPVSGQN